MIYHVAKNGDDYHVGSAEFPNWSKGWIIEHNIFHDAKCSAVCLGKEKTTGDNNFYKWRRKPGENVVRIWKYCCK